MQNMAMGRQTRISQRIIPPPTPPAITAALSVHGSLSTSEEEEKGLIVIIDSLDQLTFTCTHFTDRSRSDHGGDSDCFSTLFHI